MHTWGEAQLTPKLGLDLEGGTQLILEPKVVGSRPINQGQIDKAVDIIRQRVDGSGVAEAEVATQGGRNIVISLPGKPAAEHGRLAEQVLPAALPPRAGPGAEHRAGPGTERHPVGDPVRGHAVGEGHPARQGHPAARRRPPSPPARPPPRPGPPSREALRAPSATTPTPTGDDAHAGSRHARRECPGDERPRSGPQPHGSEPDRRRTVPTGHRE